MDSSTLGYVPKTLPTHTLLTSAVVIVLACSSTHGGGSDGAGELVITPMAGIGGTFRAQLYIAPWESDDHWVWFHAAQEAFLGDERVEWAEPRDDLWARSIAGEPFAFLPTYLAGPSARSGAADWVAARPAVSVVGDTEYDAPTWVRWAFDGSLAEFPLPAEVALQAALPLESGVRFFGVAPGSVDLGGGALGPDASPVLFGAELGPDGAMGAAGLGSGDLRAGLVGMARDGTVVMAVVPGSGGGSFLSRTVAPDAPLLAHFDPVSLELLAAVALTESPASVGAIPGGVGTRFPLLAGAIGVDGALHEPLDWSTRTYLEVVFPDDGSDVRVERWPIDRALHPNLMDGRGQTAPGGIPTERWLGPSGVGGQMLYAWFESPTSAAYIVATDGRPVSIAAGESEVVAVVRSTGALRVGEATLASTLEPSDSLFVLAFDASDGSLDRWLELAVPEDLAALPDRDLATTASSFDEHAVALARGSAESSEWAVELWSWGDAAAGPSSRMVAAVEGTGCASGAWLWRSSGEARLTIDASCEGPHQVHLGEHSWSFASPHSLTELAVSLAATP